MNYQTIINSLESSFNWLFSVYFPRIFAFLKNNELVSAALIIAFVLPSLFVIFDFVLRISSDSEFYVFKAINKKFIKNKNDDSEMIRKQTYNNRSIYHQAYINSLKFDKK